MEPLEDEFADFVEHPRLGKAPRQTGLDRSQDEPGVILHWRSKPETRVPGTAIEADLERQTPATFPVTHYFDERRICRDCGRRFLFFAAEQKYWYEERGFPLDSDCVRCPPCRKKRQEAIRAHKEYMATKS